MIYVRPIRGQRNGQARRIGTSAPAGNHDRYPWHHALSSATRQLAAPDPPIWRLLRRLCVAVDAAPEWRLCCVGGVYRSVRSQADALIKDATMREIVVGPAISLGGVAESPAAWC